MKIASYIQQIMQSDAYTNSSHPNHKEKVLEVEEYFQTNFNNKTDKTIFRWITNDSKNVCKICSSMNGVEKENIEEFPFLPPIHPNCKCEIIEVSIDNEEVKKMEKIENLKKMSFLSAKYESANDNYSAVNMYYDKDIDSYKLLYKNDAGGPSYGKYQFASKTGLVDFMRHLSKIDRKSYNILQIAGGLQAAKQGKKEFVDAWKTISKTKKFQDDQELIMFEMYYSPLEKNISELKNAPNALKAALLSTSIHFGPYKTNSFYKNVLLNLKEQGKTLTIENKIKELYNIKRMAEPNLINRFNREEKDVLYMLNHSTF